jgi:hypothetical protein
MFFAEGNTGIQYLTGSGSGSPTSLTHVQRTSSNNACDDAVAAIPPVGAPGGGDGSTVYFYRVYNNQINKYDASGTAVATSISHGSTGYSVACDGTYLYRAGSGSQSTLWRTALLDHANDTLTTSVAYQGCQGNQGSYLLYHDGYLWSKREGGYSENWSINLATLEAKQHSYSDFNVGSYCDGACVVTPATGPLAGKALIIEQGTSYWSYYNIETDTVTRMTGATNGSTEYGQGGGEIAPGVALIFSELSDQCSLIDMNPSTPTWTFGSAAPFTTTQSFGNRFGFAAHLKESTGFTYSTYASGIEIT